VYVDETLSAANLETQSHLKAVLDFLKCWQRLYETALDLQLFLLLVLRILQSGGAYTWMSVIPL
jgi:hypothetical protein